MKKIIIVQVFEDNFGYISSLHKSNAKRFQM